MRVMLLSTYEDPTSNCLQLLIGLNLYILLLSKKSSLTTRWYTYLNSFLLCTHLPPPPPCAVARAELCVRVSPCVFQQKIGNFLRGRERRYTEIRDNAFFPCFLLSSVCLFAWHPLPPIAALPTCVAKNMAYKTQSWWQLAFGSVLLFFSSLLLLLLILSFSSGEDKNPLIFTLSVCLLCLCCFVICPLI